jgi:hypothetical protein
VSRFIIKVQRSVYSSDGVPKVVVYNKDRSVTYQTELNEELAGIFGGGVKVFRWAEMVGTVVDIQEQAPWQKW